MSSAARFCGGLLVGGMLVSPTISIAQGAKAAVVVPVVVDDAIPMPLINATADAFRGRAIVRDRERGNCLICHRIPEPEERFMGDLGPDLTGVGNRLTPAQLRLRVVDSRVLNPASVMPAYHRIAGHVRVAEAFRGRPVLDAQAIEDVVAYLAGLFVTDPGVAGEQRKGAR